MQGQTLVAVYRSRAEAERVRDELCELGVPKKDIGLSVDGVVTGADDPHGDDLHIGPAAEEGPNPLAPRRDEGFFGWLFGSDVPETDRNWYGSNLRDGRTALSVRPPSSIDGERVLQTLEAHDPIDIDGDIDSGTRTEGLGPAIGAAQDFAATGSGTSAAAEARIEDRTARPLESEEAGRLETTGERSGDEVIPVVKEELEVGKRATETRRRIRTYVVEHPVEEEVSLRDERVVIERRPVSGDQAAPAGAFREREFEVIERHEEPVVDKKAHETEEVVVRKDVKNRRERVRDKVRETRVEIDKAAAGNKPGMSKDRSLGERIGDGAHELKDDVKDALTPDRKD